MRQVDSSSVMLRANSRMISQAGDEFEQRPPQPASSRGVPQSQSSSALPLPATSGNGCFGCRLTWSRYFRFKSLAFLPVLILWPGYLFTRSVVLDPCFRHMAYRHHDTIVEQPSVYSVHNGSYCGDHYLQWVVVVSFFLIGVCSMVTATVIIPASMYLWHTSSTRSFIPFIVLLQLAGTVGSITAYLVQANVVPQAPEWVFDFTINVLLAVCVCMVVLLMERMSEISSLTLLKAMTPILLLSLMTPKILLAVVHWMIHSDSETEKAAVRILLLPVFGEVLRLSAQWFVLKLPSPHLSTITALGPVLCQMSGRVVVASMSTTIGTILTTLLLACFNIVWNTTSVFRDLVLCRSLRPTAEQDVLMRGAAHTRLANILADDVSIFVFPTIIYIFNMSLSSTACHPPDVSILLWRAVLQYVVKSVVEAIPFALSTAYFTADELSGRDVTRISPNIVATIMAASRARGQSHLEASDSRSAINDEFSHEDSNSRLAHSPAVSRSDLAMATGARPHSPRSPRAHRGRIKSTVIKHAFVSFRLPPSSVRSQSRLAILPCVGGMRGALSETVALQFAMDECATVPLVLQITAFTHWIVCLLFLPRLTNFCVSVVGEHVWYFVCASATDHRPVCPAGL